MQQHVPPRRIACGLLCAALSAVTALVPACKQAGDGVPTLQAGGQGVTLQPDDASIPGTAGDAGPQMAGDDPGGSVALPAGFPDDVFLPAPRVVTSAMDIEGTKMVNLTTPMGPTRLSADLQHAMQAQGWTRAMAMQTEGGSTLVFTKDNRQAAYGLLASGRGGTLLAIRAGVD